MRLPADGDATIAAAVDAGVTVFDTARAYGDNERLVARALRSCGAERSARVVTKGGMTRPAGGWVPDGRAKAILADCEASLAALDGLDIDLYLIHAPDPRTPWRTSVRALARLVDEGLVRRVGVSNVNRDQLDEALALAPISAVQVALSVLDDRALRGGVVERCAEAGVAVIAHSPLGGPRGVRTLGRRQALTDVAAAHDVSPHQVALAWLLDLSPAVIAIPGARRPETARSAAAAATLRLDAEERAALARAFGGLRPAPAEPPAASDDAEVVVVMGIPGAGKSRIAEDLVDRGYVRLNRDERGGSLRELADALEEGLASGVRRVVLDNTYLTRATRSHVIDAARRHGLPARCVWLDTPARPGPGQPRRAGARPRRLAPEPRGAPRPRSPRGRRAHADVADARPARARAALRGRGMVRAGAGAVRADTAVSGRLGRRVRRGRRPGRGGLEGRGRTPAHRTCCSTGGRTAIPARSPRRSPSWRRRSPVRSRGRCAHTPADRRAAGAGRRSPGCPWRSHGRTGSSRRARSSSASAQPTARWRRRSAPGS